MVAVGLGGNAGIDAASTVVVNAPVVVGVPLKGPWDVAPVTWLLITDGADGAAEETVVVSVCPFCGAGAATTTAAKAKRLDVSNSVGDMLTMIEKEVRMHKYLSLYYMVASWEDRKSMTSRRLNGLMWGMTRGTACASSTESRALEKRIVRGSSVSEDFHGSQRSQRS